MCIQVFKKEFWLSSVVQLLTVAMPKFFNHGNHIVEFNNQESHGNHGVESSNLEWTSVF